MPRLGYRLLTREARAWDAPTGPPALAVMPFEVLGRDAGESYFANGVVEDIITALSRFRSFSVLARNRAVPDGDHVVDARRVAADLGVRYALQGSVRRADARLRITAQLVDAESGAHLWAERFDGALEDVLEFQDRITEAVVTRVEPRLQVAEIAHSRRERPGSFAVYDIYLRALALISSESAADNARAYALLTEGLTLEPHNPLLLSHAAWALEHRATMGWPPFGPDDRQLCGAFARRGLEHAAGDAMVMAHCGMALMQGAKEYDWGVAVLRSAVEANPNNLMIVARAGVAQLHFGDLDVALELFQRATRLSPGDPGAHFALTGIADVHTIRGDYAEALVWAGRSLAINPNFDPTLWVLIAANAHLGRMAEAGRYLDTLRRLAPGVTIAKIRAGQPDIDPGRIAAMLDGLRLAGLPEA